MNFGVPDDIKNWHGHGSFAHSVELCGAGRSATFKYLSLHKQCELTALINGREFVPAPLFLCCLLINVW